MSQAVVAKMKCNEVNSTRAPYSLTHKVKLGAVCGSEGENAAFTKYTPSGECWMNIDATAPALEFFEPGQDYYVTFTKVPKPEVAKKQ